MYHIPNPRGYFPSRFSDLPSPCGAELTVAGQSRIYTGVTLSLGDFVLSIFYDRLIMLLCQVVNHYPRCGSYVERFGVAIHGDMYSKVS